MIPLGLCQCGCGGETKPYAWNDKRTGCVAGELAKFITGHSIKYPVGMNGFWGKVDKSGECWEWMAFLDANGYGIINLRGTRQRAHRVSWESVNGPIPEGMVICHKCDNPKCVNPDHLFLGTQGDNMLDCRDKGRWSYVAHIGEDNGRAKLTDAVIEEMCIMRAETGKSYSKIGLAFGVHTTSAHRAITGRSWKHLGGTP